MGLMAMPVMDVGEVRMRVRERFVGVLMGMGLLARVIRSVFVSMVLVMHVAVAVSERLMAMRVRMALGEVQP